MFGGLYEKRNILSAVKKKSKLDWWHLEKELSTEINSWRKDRRRQWQKEDEEEEDIIYL